ncbi:MAG: metallophosphoesterase [SAR324 cluster bacterium]|nr:metallophosphoesterase [SAR324 cluster bacterium]
MNKVTVSERKIFAVGDIHGEFEKLQCLLDRLPFDEERDFLIFVGDYINRGPQSAEVISCLIDLKKRVRHMIALMGNHEYELLNYAKTGEESSLHRLRQMGVEETLKSYQDSSIRQLRDLAFLPETHKRFLTDLLPYYQSGEYTFVHAGVVPGKSLQENTLEHLVSVRSIFLNSEEDHGVTIVFGHTPFETPLVTPTKIGIDTGAAYGSMLTAVELPELRFFHA